MRGHWSQWISYKINIRHPLQLKKSKSWEPFRSYQLNSTANPAHLPQHWANIEVNGLDWQCCLNGSSQRAPRIFIFSIAMGADYSFYVKIIETHVRTYLALNILAIDRVFYKIRSSSDLVSVFLLLCFLKFFPLKSFLSSLPNNFRNSRNYARVCC